MSSSVSSHPKLTIKSLNNIIKNLDDPIRGYLFIEILRNPGITVNDLKHRMKLKGSKIYFHINKLIENDIIEYYGVEKIEYKKQKLLRKKLKLKDWIFEELVVSQKSRFSDELLKKIYILQLNLSKAVLDQQLRNLEQIQAKKFSELLKNNEIPLSVFSFVDKEIVSQISNKIRELVAICNVKYAEEPLIEVMKECSYGVITNIFSFSNEN